jgi:nucleoside-diphosphate-sugar epimerase
MKILVTGGTGLVGACLVAGLIEDGHAVRLLVRRPEQVAISLAPYGVPTDRVEVVVGDVLDGGAVAAALDGCAAVVHAAAVFSLDSRRAQEVLRTNERAAELVLGQACEAGLDPVVHISSTVTLARFGGSGPDLPLGDIRSPYSRSKLAGEVVARRLQDTGRPVVCVYPGAVLGPHDPYRGVQSELLRWQARGTFPLYPRGALHVVDVRTVAAVVRAVMEPGRGPRRYVVPGHHVGADLHYSTLARLQGRRRPHLSPPTPVLRGLTRSLDVVQRRLPGRLHAPTDPEGVEMLVRDTRLDDTPARTELGVEPVPFEESVRDTLQWLVDSGRLPARYAPRAPEPVAQG